MPWPKRTGLPTAHLLAKALKAILQKYSELYPDLLTPTQVVIINELIDKIVEFLSDVPSHEPMP